MLPTILSDNICSLLEKKDRFVFVCDIIIDSEYNILKYEFKNEIINVAMKICFIKQKILQKMKYIKINILQKN